MADHDRSVGRIVVGVSGSHASLAALDWAARTGSTLEVDIDAMMCWGVTRDHEFSSGPWYRPVEDARQRLDRAITAVFGHDIPARLRAIVRHGPTSRVLVDAGRDAEMLVIGTRGHGDVGALVLGSVGAYCAEHASCPVVITHARRNDPCQAMRGRRR